MTVQIIVAVLSSSVLVELIKFGKTVYDRKKDKGQAKIERTVVELAADMKSLKEDVKEGEETDRVLLHDRIWQMYYELKDREELTVEEDANLDYIYGEYKKKKGNHKAKAMYKYLKRKPVVAELEDDEEEEEENE